MDNSVQLWCDTVLRVRKLTQNVQLNLLYIYCLSNTVKKLLPGKKLKHILRVNKIKLWTKDFNVSHCQSVALKLQKKFVSKYSDIIHEEKEGGEEDN